MQLVQAQSLQFTSLRKHARSKAHLRLVGVLLGRPAGHDLTAAPSLDTFKTTLQLRRKGTSHRQSETVGRKAKSTKLTYCLAEALLDKDRRYLRNSSCVALSQDTKGFDFRMCHVPIQFAAMS